VVPHESGEGRVRVIGPQHDLHAATRLAQIEAESVVRDGGSHRNDTDAPRRLEPGREASRAVGGAWVLGLERALLDVRQASQALSPGREEVRY